MSAIILVGAYVAQRGRLYMKVDIICVKKNHITRVVFQDQTMHVCTTIMGAKHAKLGEKHVLLAIV